MQQKFVIITMQRSGSNMLVTMLDSHPEIKCFGELMRKTPGWMRKQGYRGALRILDKVDPVYRKDAYRFAHPYDFVEAAYATKPRASRHGFKIHIDQHREFLDALIQDPEYRIIVLRRENVLAQYSSWKISEVTGQGNAPKGTKVKTAQVDFSPRNFKSYLKRVDKDYELVWQRIRESGKSFFEIKYTELTDKERMRELAGFLEVDTSFPLEPGTEKRNPSDIVARFTNPEKVRETLSEIGHEEWGSEGRPV